MNLFKNLLFILLFFFVNASSVVAEELNSLFLIKDKNVQQVKDCVEFYIRQNNYSIVSNEKYLLMIVSDYNNDYCFISFENFEQGTFFYFKNLSNETKYLKEILLRFKLRGFKYKKINSNKMITQKNKEAACFLKNGAPFPDIETKKIHSFQKDTSNLLTDIVYDFSDEAQAEYDKKNFSQTIINSQNNQKEKFSAKNYIPQQNYEFKNTDSRKVFSAPNTQKAQINLMSVLPAGLEIEAAIQSSINTSSLESQDMISCTITKDIISSDKILIKKGSIIYGTVTSSEKAGAAYSNGNVTIRFDKILTTDGDEIALKSEPIVYQNTEINRGQKIAGTVFGGILIGVASSALGSVFCNNVDWAKTLSLGAGLGAVGGGFALLNAHGKEVELKEGTLLKIITID